MKGEDSNHIRFVEICDHLHNLFILLHQHEIANNPIEVRETITYWESSRENLQIFGFGT